MKTLRRFAEAGQLALRRLRHGILRLLRQTTPRHIIITGTDVAGVSSVRRLLAESIPELSTRLVNKPALHTLENYDLLVVSSDLDDITRATEIRGTIGPIRELLVIAVVADPRSSVCAADPSRPGVYLDSFDYRLKVGPEGQQSMSSPGVLPRWAGLDQWRRLPGVTLFEWPVDSVEKPASQLLQELHTLFPERLRPKEAPYPAGETQGLLGWNSSKDLEDRVRILTSLAPALAERAIAEGYPVGPKPKGSGQGSHRGTVIAFHTPDPIYRTEAERLKSTLDALGLEHRFYEISPETNWVRTTLLKPSWIIPVREELKGPLLYLDVDAFVHRDPWPYLGQYDGDLGAVVYENGQLNSATLWINDTEGARALLAEWKDAADQRRQADQGTLEATGDNGDQGVLKNVVLRDEASASPRFVVHRLPVNLAYIFDRTDTYCVGPVMIEQLQVSRESGGHEQRLARRRARLQELAAGEVWSL